jgi:caa(3)-type oxidase subunit IV
MTAHDTSSRADDAVSALPPGAPEAPPAASGRRYLYAWLALLVLTAISFGADQLHLGPLSTGIALGVAVIKASIVFVVFMHLDREPFPIRFVAGLNVAWVLLLCLGIAADVGTVAQAN